MVPRPLTGRHGLVRTDLYARLRHPFELGLLLIILGVAAALSSLSALALLLALHAPLTRRRLIREEAALARVAG